MSGNHHGGRPGDPGEYDPRSGEYRTVSGGYLPGNDYGTPSGEYGTAGGEGYGSGEYRTSGQYGSRHTGGGYGSRDSSGGYGSRESSGGYGTRDSSGGYGSRDSSGGAYGARDSGGGYGTRDSSGGYGARGAEYGSTSGEYRRGAPPSRRSPGSGAYRAGTGSHRIVRDRGTGRKRLALILTGVVAAVGACVLLAFTILSGLGGDGNGQVGSATAGSSPSNKAERAAVPDACELLSKQVADKLAPNADRTVADNYQSNDRQNLCVWGVYTGKNKRQLTVELRALEGTANQPPTEIARGAFARERAADEGGKALLAGQRLAEKKQLEGVGDEGYIVYSVDGGQGSGEAVTNVRVANVLVTVHYSGGNNGKPLNADSAMNGATEAVKSVVEALANAG